MIRACVAAVVLVIPCINIASDAPKTSRAAVTVNRTVPQVSAPRTGLEFSAAPTVAEIFRARVFEEPLVPIGGEPTTEENAALAAALVSYSKRSGPDDFSALTGFLDKHSASPWRAALLTGLGLEYYNTAHYSLALEAWEKAWPLAKNATDAKGRAIADRAVGELAYMCARLGRMTELEVLLTSVEGRGFVGAATEKINGAREGLWHMQNKPEISFKCGPYALQQILLSDRRLLASSPTNAMMKIFNFPSTQKGVSLVQVAELSEKVGLNYQMVFRDSSKSEIRNQKSEIEFVIPSVVHWKVDHYAAMVRQEGDRFLLQDPTFGNEVWATREALEAETSGYFLIPPGDLPRGWRSVDTKEGASVWGKGITTNSDGDVITPNDLQTGSCQGDGGGMAVSSVHLMTANLNLKDTPLAYTPPVGPPVQFTIRYNSRDPNQPAIFNYANFGPKWTCDWISYITDNPANGLANVKYYAMGGGARTFKNFDTNSQAFAPEQYDQTLLTRTGTDPISYQMLWPDGSKLIFSQSNGSVGSSRKVFLSHMVDPAGNAVTLNYDGNLRLMALTDAIGQVTTLTYDTNDIYKVTKVTDPFGRFATLEYAPVPIDWSYAVLSFCPTPDIQASPVEDSWLESITDVLGLSSRVSYRQADQVFACATCPTNFVTGCRTNDYAVDFVSTLTTPYGTSIFFMSQGGGPGPGGDTTRTLETRYPDGSRERVEYNQTFNLENPPLPFLPTGMSVPSGPNVLGPRNTYYWNRTACATGYGDYTKAKIYHWAHKDDAPSSTTSGFLESSKEPLEGRIWYNYMYFPGQAGFSGVSDKPTKIGRVLDDGQIQLYTMGYNSFGKLTNSIDPLGRTFSYLYANNGIDLLEVRQTREGQNELLSRMTYNAQHRPLMIVDAAGQTNRYTYNARGQLLTNVNAKGEMTTHTYTADGYLSIVDGPLPGTNDVVSATYDIFGRVRTMIGLSGYTLTFDYDDMDRVTKITHPDATFEQFTYDRLDVVTIRDRAGRQTFLEYDTMRQIKKQTDPLGRVTLFDWCQCGDLKSLTDPLGRTTTWLTDIQGRPTAKQYMDGSQVTYHYESASSRMRFIIDEKQQVTQFVWNRDDTLRSLAYGSAVIPTPGVSFTYDPDYERVISMTDGTGTTRYSYHPVTGTPALGAGGLASVDGPLPDDTITYAYDELNQPIHRAINGFGSTMTLDEAGRLIGLTNALGAFAYAYDGATMRLVSRSLPNGQTEERSYGNNIQGRVLERITHRMSATPISEFLYGHDVARGRIASWSQQAGAQSPNLFTFGYDAVNQLLSATVTNAGSLVGMFAYAYDPAANRLTEQFGASNYTATYNALNEINTSTVPGSTRTNEWDALDRLAAVNVGNQRTEFAYDGLNRRVAIRHLVNGSEVSLRRFVWCDGEICEERDAGGIVTKRFFPQGMKVESGPNAGTYYYTLDHLGSIRELTDANGNVRARYAYDPYGRRIKLTGDLEADFGFAGMFWSAEANLSLTLMRAYDPELGRWLSRDPLPGAEMSESPNLYAYVANDPVNYVDPYGLAGILNTCTANPVVCSIAMGSVVPASRAVQQYGPSLQRLSPLLPRVTQTASQCAPRAAKVFDVLETRIAALDATVPSVVPWVNQWRELRNYLPAWYHEMIWFERDFTAVVEMLMARHGWTFNQAWIHLVIRLRGINPEAW